jgi:hypothetical protein
MPEQTNISLASVRSDTEATLEAVGDESHINNQKDVMEDDRTSLTNPFLVSQSDLAMAD